MKPDEAHNLTDKELAKLEKRIESVYGAAAKDLQKTINSYFEKFKQRDEAEKAHIGTIVNGKEYTEADYKQWRLNQIGRGERFQALRDKVAKRYTEANETAVSYINDATPGIYSLNRNYAAYTIEKVAGSADFILWDEQTVKRLIAEQPDLMPYYPKARAVKRGIDLAYGKKQITASVTSSILQGKSIKGIAGDLQTRIPEMNRNSAIRTARTAVTGAQNAGRIDSYKAAQDMGIKVKKEWLATLDGRTRHSHAMLDGERVDNDKKFSNGCWFPGDPEGPPWEIYNCRCTLIAAVDGVDTSDAQRRARDPETGESVLISDMSYQEWAGWKSRLTTVPQNGILKSSEIQIGKSLGAAAKNNNVLLPNGNKGHLKEGTKITKVVVFAGAGTSRPVKIAQRLSERYGVPESEWRKVRGDGYVVCDDGVTRHAELHWFESHETGRIMMKVKRYFP